MPQTAAPSSSPLTPELLERLHRAGLRVTPATRAVLGLFAADPCAARCHFEVLAQLQARGQLINRVTLYRLLDRLAACGVLARHADAHERRWRFTWAGNGAAALAQPRFDCDACHCLLPLPAAALEAQQQRVAAGQLQVGKVERRAVGPSVAQGGAENHGRAFG